MRDKHKRITAKPTKASGRKFRLKIKDLHPGQLPMARLAEYMAEFARLLGSRERVHFEKIEEGSAVLVSEVEEQEEPKIAKRLELVRLNGGVAEARIAYKNIDDMLAEDNTSALLIREKRNLIEFPGKNRPRPEVYDQVTQADSLDGMLIVIGGRDSTVPVHLMDVDGRIYKCNTSRSIAKAMAPFLFGSFLRVFGTAEWRRDSDEAWSLKNLNIEHFLELSSDSPVEVFSRLNTVEGNYWHTIDDPYEFLHQLRHDDEEAS